MRSFLQAAGTLEEVIEHPIEGGNDFRRLAALCSRMDGSVALLSGGESDCARYNLLAARPWLSLRAWRDHIEVLLGRERKHFRMDPFEALREIETAFALPADESCLPVKSGLFGYLAFDLKDRLEKLPRTSLDDCGLPDLCLFAPSVLIIQDRWLGNERVLVPRLSRAGLSDPDAAVSWAYELLASPWPDLGGFGGNGSGFRSSLTRKEYLRAVRAVKEYILDGHVYQVNLSQRYTMGFTGDPFALFCNLFAMNPAPFFAFINAGDHQIVSTSPERFLALRGRAVETRPIKGTRPRGATPEEDAARARELQESSKDDAELSMIVDLLRNDLGKVCRGATVSVREHKRLERYSNVFHLVSIISGQLEEGATAADLLRATFPGGSVTGCPKIRSLEIIDELEPVRRHVYTGSIGYVGFDGSLDLSIAIRTATVCRKRLHFSVGGGVVFDSDPAAEYEETLHKGQTLLRAFKGSRAAVSRPTSARVWLDGKIVPAEDARIPALCPGLQYGFGHFETLRADAGSVHFLAEHLERFERTWTTLYGDQPPDLTWEAIISQVIQANGLERGTAAVKLLACKGEAVAWTRCHLLVTASAYRHRLERLGKAGLDLMTYPESRQSPLADHKSLNYLYYHLAGQWAAARGADEALILNPDGSVSETNSASLLLLSGSCVLVPVSEHVLPGVTVERSLEILTRSGYNIRSEAFGPERLHRCDLALLTNSLMGAVPVQSLDGAALPFEQIEVIDTLNDHLLRGPSC